MTPRQAFDDVILRANRLLRIHDGLINTRQRGIRADWKRGFCSLMHWKQSANIQRVDGKDAIIVLRDGASLSEDDLNQDAMDDLLRSALVYGVSALDRYVHERVCKGIIKAYREATLSKEQKDFSIPLTLALSAAESLRKAHKAGKDVRPANEIRKAIQEMLHTRPFQSWRDIDYAFRLIGVTDMAGKIQTSKGLGDLKAYKKQLNAIVERRHKIVHEGDLPRHERGGIAKKVPISRAFIVSSLTHLEDFVNEMEKI